MSANARIACLRRNIVEVVVLRSEDVFLDMEQVHLPFSMNIRMLQDTVMSLRNTFSRLLTSFAVLKKEISRSFKLILESTAPIQRLPGYKIFRLMFDHGLPTPLPLTPSKIYGDSSCRRSTRTDSSMRVSMN